MNKLPSWTLWVMSDPRHSKHLSGENREKEKKTHVSLYLDKEIQEHLECITSLFSLSGSMLSIYLKTQWKAKVPSAFSGVITASVNIINCSPPRISFNRRTTAMMQQKYETENQTHLNNTFKQHLVPCRKDLCSSA